MKFNPPPGIHRALAAAILAVLALHFPTATAETETDHNPYRLADLTVTDTTAKPKPGVFIIDRQTIAATGVRSVAQALRFAPGITLSNGRRNQPEPALHGFGQDRLLVLVDGVPYYESNFGKLNLDQFPADIVERIEILPANASLIHGPNALGGVIHIITRQGGDIPTTNVNAELGTNNTANTSISHGATHGPWHYWLAYSRRETDGFRLSSDFDETHGTITTNRNNTETLTLDDGKQRENADFAIDAFWARLGFNPTPGSDIALSAHIIESERGTPWNTDNLRVFTNQPAFSDIRRFLAYDDRGLDLAFSHQINEKWKIAARTFFHRHRDDLAFYDDIDTSDQIAVSTYKDDLYGASTILEHFWSTKHTTRAAFHAWFDKHRQRDDAYLPFADSKARTLSAAIEHTTTHNDRLRITIGASADAFKITHAETTETDANGDFANFANPDTPDTLQEINPALNLEYDLHDGTTAYAGFAGRTRFPTLNQLYDNRSGNPELQAERAWNVNAGVRHRINDTLTLNLEAFAHRIRNWISRDGSEVDSLYRNYADIHMRGATIALEWQPLDRLNLRFDYTCNHARDHSDNRRTDAVRLVPRHKLSGILDWTTPLTETAIQFSAYFVADTYSQLPSPSDPDAEPQRVDDAPVVALRISQPVQKQAEIYAVVDNLLDRDYEYEDGYPAPGREFRIGFNATF